MHAHATSSPSRAAAARRLRRLRHGRRCRRRESVARLERSSAPHPPSAAVNRSLGIAYYKARPLSPRRARRSRRRTRLDPKDGTTALYLGLTAEALNDLPAATRGVFVVPRSSGATSRVRGQLQARLAALARQGDRGGREGGRGAGASLWPRSRASPRTIAVLPMRFTGADTTLEPLERGLADLLTTDLARSSQLTLVERVARAGAARRDRAPAERRHRRGDATSAPASCCAPGGVVQGSHRAARRRTAARRTPRSSTCRRAGSRRRCNGSDAARRSCSTSRSASRSISSRELGVTLTTAERNADRAASHALARRIPRVQPRSDGGGRRALRRREPLLRRGGAHRPGLQCGAAEEPASRAGRARERRVTPATVEASLNGTREGAVVTARDAGHAATVSPAERRSAGRCAAQPRATSIRRRCSAATARRRGRRRALRRRAEGCRRRPARGTDKPRAGQRPKVTIVITRAQAP